LHFTDINRSSPELPALNTRYNQRSNYREKYLTTFAQIVLLLSVPFAESNSQQNLLEHGEKNNHNLPRDWSAGSRGSVGCLRGEEFFAWVNSRSLEKEQGSKQTPHQGRLLLQ
jgi:hypothetical protein